MRVHIDIPPGPRGAALYLAWCAYPEDTPEEDERREKWATVAEVVFYKRQNKRPPPELRGHKRENAMGLYKRGLKRLQCRRRLAVWLMVRQVQPEARGGLSLSDAIAEQLDNLPAGYGYGQKGEINERHVRALMWKESLPALAMMVPVTWLTMVPHERAMWADLLYAKGLRDWQDAAIDLANNAAAFLEEEFAHEYALGRLLVPHSSAATGVANLQLKSPGFLPDASNQTRVGLAATLQLGPKK